MATKSVSVTFRSERGKCWAKINRLRNQRLLPFPARVTGGNDLPGNYLPSGDEELLPGDALFEGVKGRYGWDYRVTVGMPDGNPLIVSSARDNLSKFKASLKAAGMPVYLLQGSGDLAALVRIVSGYRLGLPLPASAATEKIVYLPKPLRMANAEYEAKLIRAAVVEPETAPAPAV